MMKTLCNSPWPADINPTEYDLLDGSHKDHALRMYSRRKGARSSTNANGSDRDYSLNPLLATRNREMQRASDKRSPPGYRTTEVLSEGKMGRSLKVTLFGGHGENLYAREVNFQWFHLVGQVCSPLLCS